jgi:tellurite resistance protein TerC
MIAGVSWAWWAGFHAVVAALLLADFFLPAGSRDSRSDAQDQNREPRRSPMVAWLATAGFVLAAAGFACWIGFAQGRQAALEFAAGYTIEASLSVDNLFVFLLLFRAFDVGPADERKALHWGVWGAFVLRAAFIEAGIALLRRFSWVTWVFGALLLYAGWRTMRGGRSWISGLRRPKSSAAPLWMVILVVEVTDLLFATDSIPALLSVTHNPFVAYTSNVAAILGLRSFYFALAAVLPRLRYLHYGLAAILAFTALKMLAARWITVPVTISLIVIAAILAVCAIASVREPVSESASCESATGLSLAFPSRGNGFASCA